MGRQRKHAVATVQATDIPPPPAGGPGGPMEIVFSFDTTGSMHSLLEEVRRNLTEMITRLQGDIPNLRIAVIAHGDYCDGSRMYLVKMLDFQTDTKKLVDFVNNAERTSGGDGDVCYEYVLKNVRTSFSWSDGTQKSLVMIGDSNPHEPDYHYYKYHTPIDWRKEADALFNDVGVHIYSVQCGSKSHAVQFYKSIAEKTEGTYLQLGEFSNIFDLMMAICYREHGAEYFLDHEKEVREPEKRLTKELDSALVRLRKSASDASTVMVSPSSSICTKTPSTPPTPSKVRVRKPALKRLISPAASPRPTKRVKLSSSVSEMTKTQSKTSSCKPVSKKRKPIAKKRKPIPVKKRKPISKKKIFVTKIASKSLVWSQWKLAMSVSAPKDGSKTWRQRRGGNLGYRDTYLFNDTKESSAVYEFAVVKPRSTQKHVVYFRTTVGFCGLRWDTYLLRQSHVVAQVDDIMRRKCDVYVRRATLCTSRMNRQQKLRKCRVVAEQLTSKYDYAWCKKYYGRRQHRLLTKSSVLISDDKY